jgi:4,5-dihydroxyphthalate decarboxylase
LRRNLGAHNRESSSAYDRHVPLFMGGVKAPPGLTLRVLEVGMSPPRRDGIDRHGRFLQGKEFDIAETSLSSHVIAVSRGAPFVGIPVFPRRLFSQNHIFVNVAFEIDKPEDLVGKRVLIRGRRASRQTAPTSSISSGIRLIRA